MDFILGDRTSSVVKTPKLYWPDVGILRRMKAVASALGKDWACGLVICQGNEIKKV